MVNLNDIRIFIIRHITKHIMIRKMPIPTHLKKYFVLKEGNEFKCKGNIICTCKNDIFNIFTSNDKHIINLKCVNCEKEFNILDSDKHGWQGFVANQGMEEFYTCNRTEPFIIEKCQKCSKEEFFIEVYISSQGIEDFIMECLEDDEENKFSLKDWVDAFEYMNINIKCKNCNNYDETWVALETM